MLERRRLQSHTDISINDPYQPEIALLCHKDTAQGTHKHPNTQFFFTTTQSKCVRHSKIREQRETIRARRLGCLFYLIIGHNLYISMKYWNSVSPHAMISKCLSNVRQTSLITMRIRMRTLEWEQFSFIYTHIETKILKARQRLFFLDFYIGRHEVSLMFLN